jgi:glutamine synthetase
VTESAGLLDELWAAIGKLEDVNLAENQPDEEPLKWAKYMRDKVIPAMDGVRAVADRLEGIVADDLWPLPKYSEMLFIK